MALGFPDVIRSEIGGLTRFRRAGSKTGARRTAGFDQHTVTLNADRIHAEHQRLPTVVIGAEEQLDVVVLRDLVAISQRIAHRAGWRICANSDVQRGGGVEHEHFGTVARRDAIGRIELRKSGQQRGLPPDRLIEHAVHYGGGVIARRGDGQRTAAAVVHRAGMRFARRRGNECEQRQNVQRCQHRPGCFEGSATARGIARVRERYDLV